MKSSVKSQDRYLPLSLLLVIHTVVPFTFNLLTEDSLDDVYTVEYSMKEFDQSKVLEYKINTPVWVRSMFDLHVSYFVFKQYVQMLLIIAFSSLLAYFLVY